MHATQWDILNLLNEKYGQIGSGLDFTNPFELLVATILSAQATDVRVNMVTPELFRVAPTPQAMAALSEMELSKIISSIGLYRNKSKNILKASQKIIDDFHGLVPDDRESLMTLAGVGRKTANVVLCNAFHKPAFAVDTHVFRVSRRLGFASGANVEKVEEEVTQLIPQSLWCDAHHWFIWHGRGPCKARQPKCEDCFLKKLCPNVIANCDKL